MLIYHSNPGPRLHYIAGFFSEDLCGLKVRITSDTTEFIEHQGPAICYHSTKLKPECLHVEPWGLLEEEGIRDQEIVMSSWNELPCFFGTNGDIPFDIFSASFFLLSRYEEYLPFSKDIYGRYAHTNSAAYRNNFLHLPLLDLWALEVRKMMGLSKAEMIPGKRVFRFVPTYDIDMAWCYLHKGFLRNIGGLLRSLLAGDFKQASRRVHVLRGQRPDPFDVYEWLDALHLKFGLKPFYFFLLAFSNSEYDKNISPLHKEMRSLISYHAAGYNTGIHPSWQSRYNEIKFRDEMQELADITRSDVTLSRFHYLAFELPGSYRKLLRNGITEDFSMGYGSINGFRASVATPFRWYDLEKNTSTGLTVHPFCWMDANSYYEQLYTPAQAFAELKSYHDVVKKTGGVLSTISHNNFFSDEPGFAGWKEVYELFLDEVVYWDV